MVGGKKGVCSPSPAEKPPKISFKLEKAGDVPNSTESWSNNHLPIDIIFTIDCEELFLLAEWINLYKLSYKSELGYVYFGYMRDASDQEKLICYFRGLLDSGS